MSVAQRIATPVELGLGERVKWAFADAAVMTKRSLLRYIRIPSLLVFSTIQPVMFVLLFRYVFGGAIATGIPGVSYVDFLMPGIFVQTAIFGATATGIGLAEDLKRGMIERFKSLPMARSAVLAGRTTSDTIRNVFVISLMTVVGTLVGFRFHGGILAAAGALLLAIAFGFTFSWVSAFIGLTLKDAESTQAASFIWIFPLTFASSAFVPTEFMPGWLQAFADANPVTLTVNALRGLVLDRTAAADILQSLAWIVGLLIVFVPLAVRQYRKVS